MSSNAPDQEGYRRDDWWGTPEIETVGDQHREHGTTWETSAMRDEKAEAVAWELLRDVALKLCAVSVDDPAKTPTELTDPCVYPHGEGNRDHLRQARVNEAEGYITGGESTGVRLADVSTERFLSVVRILLDHWTHIGHIDQDKADRLFADAQSMKSNPDIRDKEAIKRLVKDALHKQDFAAVVDMMVSTWKEAGHIDSDEASALMVEAVRLRNQPDRSDEDVLRQLADRALPLPTDT